MAPPPRLDFIEYGALMAFAASCRSTCPRAHVGDSLFDKDRVVVATGYNGAPPGEPQCDEIGCLMIDGHCKRTRHAEKNAYEFSGRRKIPGGYAFITVYPCQNCFDLLVKMEVKNVFYYGDYPHVADQDYVSRVSRERGMVLKKWPFTIKTLLQKAINFHQGPGGLLIADDKLVIEERVNTDWNE